MLMRPAALIFAFAASSFAWAEALPERVAYLHYVEGSPTFKGAGERASSTLPERPLLPGDRVATDSGGRAELVLGSAIVRLDESTELSLLDLDETILRLELNAGVVSVHARELFNGETFELVTPNTIVAIDAPGEYRVEVLSMDATALIVHRGAATLATSGGPVRVADGQRVRLAGHDAFASLDALPSADAFDEWVLERELQLAAAEPPPEAPGYDTEYGELDRYGDWYDDSTYGRVWTPNYTGSWRPFHDGRWQHTGHGRSWVDAAPWGFSFAFTSGHWTFVHGLQRWCWVPPHHGHEERFAQDTRPFGRPRSSKVVTRRLSSDRRSAYQGDHAMAGRTRSSTPMQSVGGGQRPQPGVSGASRSGVATMRSSGSSSRRSQLPSSATRRSSSVFATSSASRAPP